MIEEMGKGMENEIKSYDIAHRREGGLRILGQKMRPFTLFISIGVLNVILLLFRDFRRYFHQIHPVDRVD